jgi:hypothetical protein
MVAEGFVRAEMRAAAMLAPDGAAAIDALIRFAPPDVPRWLSPGET